MLAMWDNNTSKQFHEELIAEWVGKVGDVADLGCGAGRYANLLDCKHYTGFDTSMLLLNKAISNHPDCSFMTADIFNFSSDFHYDLVMMIDVAQHQKQPIETIGRIVKLWHADRYLFSLLVGDEREDLLLSTIEDYQVYSTFLLQVKLGRFRIEKVPNEHFSWLLFECFPKQEE